MFDEQALNLCYQQDSYQQYLNLTFSIDHFEKQIQSKKVDHETRVRLVNSLNKQYQGITVSAKVEEQINSLSDPNTFTVTTGHQLSLFTGPLYFVIKIVHTIKLAEELNQKYPNNHFVPVYWMATEDHDFEEIRSFEIFNRTMTWDSEQTGAVGHFNLHDLGALKEDLHGLFGNHPEGEIHKLIDTFDGVNLAEATRKLVNAMFQEFGLIIIDGDDSALKDSFASVVERELTAQFSEKEVLKTSQQMKVDGLKIQVNPREINLFYLNGKIRSRIEKREENYFIEGIGIKTKEELLTELKEHPQRFSPNVILRPLYQEMILPNLTYVGGLGEISYWLQLKGVFDAVNCPFPMLSVRNSIMWVDGAMKNRLDKLGIHIEDTFVDIDQLKKNYLIEHAEVELDFTQLDELNNRLTEEMSIIIDKVDPGKKAFAEAEQTRLSKQVSAYKDKVIRFSKAKHDDTMKQLEVVKDRLFPGNGLQERKVNFFNFCSDGDVQSKIAFLHSAIDPFDGDFVVIIE